MIKIKYPKDSNKFENDYKASFDDIESRRTRLRTLFNSDIKFSQLKKYSFDDIITAPIEILSHISLEYRNISDYFTDREMMEILNIFNYDSVGKYLSKYPYEGICRDDISDFFKRYSKELNISTCYFCNIDFINSYSIIEDYESIIDFLNYAPYKSLVTVDKIGKETANKIINYRTNKFKKAEDLDKLKGVAKDTREKIIESYNEKIDSRNDKHLFTLDHVIDKGKNPILALSLYNLVPSCYACNSKVKSKRTLIDKISESKLSPSSKDFKFNESVKFKLILDNKEIDENTDLTKNIVLNLDCEDEDYEKFVNLFQLRGRYAFHKKEALRLVELKKKYGSTQIKKFVEMLYGKDKIITMPFLYKTIQKDVFGSELFDSDIQLKPLTKLKRDIAKQIGIKGIKDD